IILSSLTPTELMQGKIFGYFLLGLIQVFIWIALAIPFILWKVDQTILSYLFTYETVVFLIFAVLGYLFYAALFVSLGATIEDVSSSGNFQGMVFMVPFIPVVFISSILENPNSTLVKVISYIPFTSPSVMIFRLTLMENWVWWEIGLAILVLIVSIFVFMKLAGKIFKVGIQKYGKNATVSDILSWLKSS
ncbi:MAG TPA: ABC transporter permease, partial [Pseudogracilibacillus sp.]|nr:ABC transporter permease [Pseudogracilibacillus sp.]